MILGQEVLKGMKDQAMQIKREVPMGLIKSRRKLEVGFAGKDKSVLVLFRMNQETIRKFHQ